MRKSGHGAPRPGVSFRTGWFRPCFKAAPVGLRPQVARSAVRDGWNRNSPSPRGLESAHPRCYVLPHAVCAYQNRWREPRSSDQCSRGSRGVFRDDLARSSHVFFLLGKKKERERETELEDVTRLQRLDHRLLSRFPVPEEASKLYTNLTRRRVCAPRGTESVSGTPAGPFCHMNDHPFFFKTFSPFPPPEQSTMKL